jgi:tRNA (adenine22-N1)-methyltransferase
MPKTALDARLCAAAEYVRQEAYFADIGTDHAYLPVFLVESGRIHRAVAADVAAGPLSRAKETVAAAHLTEAITLIQTDGLTGLAGLGLTDIALCGMGGELIAAILDAAPFVRDGAIRLILQPMSRAAHLRTYLAAQGFAVERESLCRARGRLYACLCAHYTGVPYSLSRAEAELGYYETHEGRHDPLFSPYLAAHIATVRRRVSGQHAGGEDAQENELLLQELEAFL